MSGGHRAAVVVPGKPARLVPTSAIALFAVLILCGYVFKWQWTGFAKDDQLWDMLHVLVLPVVLATLPLWYRTRQRWHVEWRLVLTGVVVAFAVIVVGGYALDWTWTGFQGNTFWDWLELLALPVVVAFLPLWFETHRRLEARWRVAFALVLAGFVVVVLGGYRLHWAWTGFEGNTMRDWLQLLVVPFVLPATLAWFAARREAAEASGAEPAEPVEPTEPAEPEVPRQITIPDDGGAPVSGVADRANS
jgi:hypothetical protein